MVRNRGIQDVIVSFMGERTVALYKDSFSLSEKGAFMEEKSSFLSAVSRVNCIVKTYFQRENVSCCEKLFH